MKPLTVGELIARLQQFNLDLPVFLNPGLEGNDESSFDITKFSPEGEGDYEKVVIW